MTRTRTWIALLTCVTLLACAHAANDGGGKRASSNKTAPPPSGLDLRQRIIAVSSGAKEKMWAFEDQITAAERLFIDQMRGQLRESDRKFIEELGKAEDWKKAKREYADRLRKQQQDLKQQTRIRREENELQIIRFIKEREADLKAFTTQIEEEMKEYKDDPGYSTARADLDESKNEMREVISKFKERVKNLKPKENFWE